MRNFVAIFRDKNWNSFEYAMHATDEAHVEAQIAHYLKAYKGRKFISYYEVK